MKQKNPCSKILNNILFIKQEKMSAKIFGLKTWCTKKPFGYRVLHHLATFKRLVDYKTLTISCRLKL